MRLVPCGLVLGLSAFLGAVALAADPPAPKIALSFKPVQSDVDYEIPDAKTIDQCKVTPFREGKLSGWSVQGPAGQVFRRYLDTNNDNTVDIWCYYRNGLEVYRDIDSNGNNKVDQSRWLNIGGTRWGIDQNEDGKIDSWRIISADEVTRVAIKALISQDAALLGTLLIDKADLEKLGITGDLAASILKSAAEAPARMRQVANSSLITPRTAFVRFEGSNPGIVPADQIHSSVDVFVYENAMAMVSVGEKIGIVQMGELVRVGEVWKLTSAPIPVEGNQIEMQPGLLLSPDIGAPAEVVDSNLTPEMRELIGELQELDKKAPGPQASKADSVRFSQLRVQKIAQIRAVATGESRETWFKQEVDSIAAGVQTDTFPNGVQRLKSIEADIQKSDARSPMYPYVAYRRMLAEYSVDMLAATTQADREKIQTGWLNRLEEFVKVFPQGEDTPDAALQLAISNEFAGKVDEAKTWYGRIVKDFESSQAAPKAAGALRRLELKGKAIVLQGKTLDGKQLVNLASVKKKLMVVLFWSTWCKPCQEDLPLLKALYQQYNSRGFEIVGVNLDDQPQLVIPFIQKNAIPWPQIGDGQGMNGPLGQAYGIITLPTMLIVDDNGTVVNRAASVNDIKTALDETFPKK